MACDFIGRTVGSAAPCRIYLQTARRRSASGTAFQIWKNMDSAPQAN
jgi:hypothetical protein